MVLAGDVAVGAAGSRPSQPDAVSDCVISLFCYVSEQLNGVGPDPVSEEAGEHEGPPECPTV